MKRDTWKFDVILVNTIRHEYCVFCYLFEHYN